MSQYLTDMNCCGLIENCWNGIWSRCVLHFSFNCQLQWRLWMEWKSVITRFLFRHVCTFNSLWSSLSTVNTRQVWDMNVQISSTMQDHGSSGFWSTFLWPTPTSRCYLMSFLCWLWLLNRKGVAAFMSTSEASISVIYKEKCRSFEWGAASYIIHGSETGPVKKEHEVKLDRCVDGCVL